ncbi:aldo/keto reductase family protein [Acidicapsa ligni]|uniref:aldo/keto reductase family protein n=1 Tax=Acidicapsa ligni TaxID=542300 RepID=UPI0021DFFF4F|nr:aldo/keto reductase [Acidicapsa ligni]
MSLITNKPIPTFLYGTAWKEERTAGLTEAAIRNGFRAIDTANQRKHYFEAGVGEGIAAACADDLVTRDDLFLQTKFTYVRGQDHRLPYDAVASPSVQVAQSMASSLEHLGTDYVDSYMLHGPASGYAWADADAEVWAAMQRERDAGRARLLGVSNISLEQLEQMIATHRDAPAFVQNRCYARLGWDREVRALCNAHGIVYQGFSLLTVNADVLGDPYLRKTAMRHRATTAQVVFSFARSVGMLPLTGTSASTHMLEDLASERVLLSQDEIRAIESLAG